MNVFALEERKSVRAFLSHVLMQKCFGVGQCDLRTFLHDIAQTASHAQSTVRQAFLFFFGAVETGLAGFDEKNTTTNRVVSKSGDHTWRRLIVDPLRCEHRRADEILKVVFVYVDQVVRWTRAAHHFEGNLFANLGDLVFKGADAGLPRVVCNDKVSHIRADANIIYVVREARFLDRLWVQVIVKDVQLFVVRVSSQFNDFHAVQNRRVQRAQVVCCAQKEHL